MNECELYRRDVSERMDVRQPNLVRGERWMKQLIAAHQLQLWRHSCDKHSTNTHTFDYVGLLIYRKTNS